MPKWAFQDWQCTSTLTQFFLLSHPNNSFFLSDKWLKRQTTTKWSLSAVNLSGIYIWGKTLPDQSISGILWDTIVFTGTQRIPSVCNITWGTSINSWPKDDHTTKLNTMYNLTNMSLASMTEDALEPNQFLGSSLPWRHRWYENSHLAKLLCLQDVAASLLPPSL